jgi:hypothetical protein
LFHPSVCDVQDASLGQIDRQAEQPYRKAKDRITFVRCIFVQVEKSRRHLHGRIRDGQTGYSWAGFLIPTGRTEPAGSGTGLPVRFGRKSCKPDKFEFQTKFLSASGSNRYTDRFNQYTGPVRPVPSRLKKNRISGELDVFSNFN